MMSISQQAGEHSETRKLGGRTTKEGCDGRPHFGRESSTTLEPFTQINVMGNERWMGR